MKQLFSFLLLLLFPPAMVQALAQAEGGGKRLSYP